MQPNENENVDIDDMGNNYRRLLEASLDPMILIDLYGTIKSLNKAAEDIVGMDRNKILGTNFSEYFTQPDRAKELYTQVLSDEKVFRYELKLKNISGYTVPMLFNASVYRDVESRVTGILVTGSDSTNLKNSQNELEYLKKNFEKLIKEKSDELSVANKELAFQSDEKIDTDAELVKLNKELEFQNVEKDKRAAELILANIELAFQSEEKDKRAAELILANIELAFQSEEKEKRAVELIVTNRDLVDQKETIKELNDELTLRICQLESANVELEDLYYSISHDLKAPVRHITGYVSLMQNKYQELLPEDGQRYLDTISGAASNMGELIDSLLKFARIGKVEINAKSVDMNEIIDNLIRPIKEQDIEKRIEFNINPMPLAYADIDMMKSVWSNLIENAVKFTKNKDIAVISIGSEQIEDDTVFYIKDNGTGFDMKYVAKLFTVFQRIHSREEYEGTGIGLASVKRIVNRHGGEIWAEGKIDEGAEFYFSLNKLFK